MDGALERIQDLCKRENITIKTIEEKLGFSNGTIGKWKKAQDVPYGKIKAVADLLNSTPEFILYGKLNVHKSVTGKEYYFNDQTAKIAQEIYDNPQQQWLFHNTRNMPPEDLDALKTLVEALKRKEKRNE